MNEPRKQRLHQENPQTLSPIFGNELDQGLLYSLHARGDARSDKDRFTHEGSPFILNIQREGLALGDDGIGQEVSDEQVQDSLHWAEEFLQADQQVLRT